ncbi:MAG: exosortase/archaeosortase family protein [Myxococcota bacterium]|nr:exosortase/archaeosortase family protein [Myxococcota bacterium]
MNSLSAYFGDGPILPSRRGLTWQTIAVLVLLTITYIPILGSMVQHWRIVPDYSHGFLIVPLALIFAYEKKFHLKAARIEGSWWGVGLLTIGLGLLALGQLGSLLSPLRAGYVFSLMGFVLLFLGAEVFRLLLFPMCFLLLMVPLPQSLVNVVAFPLQLIAAKWAVSALQLIGVPVLLEGNIIHLASGDLFVAEACSGLRSLMALMTLGVVFAHFFRRDSLLQQLILIASTVPIAILVNALRVAVTGFLAHQYGHETAGGVIHDFQGLITFSLAFLLLLFESRLLSRLLDSRALSGNY